MLINNAFSVAMSKPEFPMETVTQILELCYEKTGKKLTTRSKINRNEFVDFVKVYL